MPTPKPSIGWPRGVGSDAIAEQSRQAGQACIDRTVDQARRTGVAAATALVDGGDSIPDTIVGEGERWSADLIVVGTHRHRGLNRLILGSVAERVARTASVPVLLIPQT